MTLYSLQIQIHTKYSQYTTVYFANCGFIQGSWLATSGSGTVVGKLSFFSLRSLDNDTKQDCVYNKSDQVVTFTSSSLEGVKLEVFST